jgi:hypothetical protein
MNAPLNPVPISFSADAPVPKIAPKKSHAGTGKRQTVTRLSNPENYALIEWLKAYKQQPDDTIHTMTRKAAEELKNDRINYNHVQQRLVEFGIPAPTRGGSATNAELATRVETLEKQVASIIELLNRRVHQV